MEITIKDHQLFLEECIRHLVNTVIQGVNGVGKTTLLRKVCCEDFRKDMARKKVLVSEPTSFPSDICDDEAVYSFFLDVLKTTLTVVEDDVERTALQNVLNTQDTLQDTARTIKDTLGYQLVFVVDNFEEFTHSGNITAETHETLFKLSEINGVRYMVATELDINSNSLPQGTSHSLFLQLFGNKPHVIRGWTTTDIKEYICSTYEEHMFSDDAIEKIEKYSGGIAAVVVRVSELACECIRSEGKSALKFQPFWKDAVLQKHFRLWARDLTEGEAEALEHLANTPTRKQSETLAALEQSLTDQQVVMLSLMAGETTADRKAALTKLATMVSEGQVSMLETVFEKLSDDQKGALVSLAKGRISDKDAANFEEPFRRALLTSPPGNTDGRQFACWYFKQFCKAGQVCEPHRLTKKLSEQIENGKKEELMSTMQALTYYIPGAPKDCDVRTMAVVYPANVEQLLSQEVLDFVEIGWKLNELYKNTYRCNVDYSVLYRPYYKAIEKHLSQTLVPVMKVVAPHAKDCNGLELSAWTDTVDTVTIKRTLVESQVGLDGSVCLQIQAWFSAQNKFQNDWWNAVITGLETLIEQSGLDITKKGEALKRQECFLEHLSNSRRNSFAKKCRTVFDEMNIRFN